MPTVMEPKATEEAKSQPPARPEPELFAAEIEMEKKSSNFLPLVFILGLVVVVGGAIFYFVKGARDVLTVPAATNAINADISRRANLSGNISQVTSTLTDSLQNFRMP